MESSGTGLAPATKPIKETETPAALPLSVEGQENDSDHRLVLAAARRLWDQRRLLVRVTLSGLLAATLLAFLLPKEYVSTTQLMPPDTRVGSSPALLAGLSGPASGLAGKAGDLLGMKSTGALFVGILRSRTVADRLIERFDLKKVYGVRLLKYARTRLEDNTSISEDRKSGIITLTVKDRDPRRASEMAQAYVGELNQLVAELTTSAAHRERVFLEERLKDVKRDLVSAAKEFSEFSSKNTVIDIKEQGRAMVDAAATLQGQLIAAQSELKGLEQIYTDNNVRVRALRARITELQHQLEKLGGKPMAAGGAGADPAADAIYPSIRKLPLLGVTYADLYRRTKIQETVYELFTQQYELAKVEEAKGIPSVKVLDVADVPEKRSFPPRLLVIFLGSLLSLCLGVAWVLGDAAWKSVDPQDPGKVLALEILQTTKAHMRWGSQDGFGTRAISRSVWSQSRRRGEQPKADQ